MPDLQEYLRKTLTIAVARILGPVVRLWLRKGYSYNAFAEVVRWVFVREAENEPFRLKNRKQTDSRISVLTGLTRHQVHHYRSTGLEESPESAKSNRATRVLTGWLADPRYRNSKGQPLDLPLDGSSPSFLELVRDYGGDISPRAVMDELTNSGNAALVEGNLRLISRGNVPTKDECGLLEIVGYDAGELIATLEHNLNAGDGPRRFQKKVCYDNIPAETLVEFKKFAGAKAQTLLEELNDFLAKAQDKKRQPDNGREYRELGMGVYYFERECP